ncbi:LysE family translocator [Desulfuromonas acetoxidans]|uniref:Lysine exporter protein (LYSE/YGGA) n=1 Tax=Desulfuromonas acetoxidans (strain DSM 684 / 11070) TaxID=281689 RepID=Q1JVS8_DESA6|nr:LysE family translocator [Desulfuromonas acetoxidans]EAT14358.1 Lysine exporter protein (LYSE/YGGA) [Desulfuromonas acetoxidans DSM 684]MBF0644573.1 LysE family translocator [Desulfuromonas acetoxidans]NVD23900.1 LysE family translocator [Desulfuromonas acetoxidans]NVE16197.1 LysE family translocator [Desulfuromonas acetoxidans]
MPSPDTLISFLIAAVLLGLAPGPDNLFVLTQSALHGAKAGWLVTAGLCTGLLGHTTAVAFGVAVVFEQSLVAFTLLKLAGVLYLLYLAWLCLRSRHDDAATTAPRLSGAKLYRRGVIMNLTNPKVSLFFLAFLPQFTQPDMGPIRQQLLLLGALFILATIVVFGLIATLSGSIGHYLQRHNGARRTLDRLSAVVFIALAAKLLTTSR